jgi:hypothetical protein
LYLSTATPFWRLASPESFESAMRSLNRRR